MRFRLLLTAVLCAMTSPDLVQAAVTLQNRTLKVNTLCPPSATCAGYNFWTIIGNIMQYLTGAIGAVAITMFVIGALFVTLSGIKEDWRQKGKDLMIGSVISLAVVLGAYAILRMLEYFLTR